MTEILVETNGLLGIFGLPTPLSNEESGIYWFEYQRPDGLKIALSFSIYERKAGIVVRLDENRTASSINMNDCSRIQVLDDNRRIIELKGESNARCVLALSDNDVLSVTI
jgi:hypothetical protein